jgi:hypothetical protein
MEDLIYILLGLLWLVFTFYSQSKKRKEKQLKAEKQSQQQQEDGGRSILEDIFGDMEEEPKEIEIIEQTPKPKPYKNSFEDQYEDIGIASIDKTGKNYHTEADNLIKETSILNQEEIQEQELVSENNNIRSLEGKHKRGNNNFNARKALIYQAIMDTPYI